MAHHGTISALLALGLSFGAAVAQDAAPQATAPAASRGYTGAVTADNVFIRSGPRLPSSYPFGRLMLGDLVQVDEEAFGWAKVRTSGPAFANTFGYVVANESVTLSPDGSTLTVVNTAEIRAPNLDADGNPDSSFKVIGTLPAGATAKVTGQVSGDREQVHKIALPGTATGWININYLRRASQSEVSAGTAAASTPAVEPATTSGTASTGTVTVETKSEPQENPAPEKTAAPPPPPVKTEAQLAAERRRADFKSLEATWAKVKAEPQETAELAALRGRYQALAADPAVESDIKSVCGTRIKQLDIQAEIQKGIQNAKAVQADAGKDTDKLKALRIAMEARSDYTAVGVLNASTVYDGVRLPLLFRLTDPSSGHTVAYVTAKDPNMLSTMLGTLVGIRGSQRFDEALKVNIIDPGTVDILTIRKDAQVSTSGG